jgi:hypothetical protein
MMSAKRTAASTPCRCTGWSVTCAQSSGVRARSKNEWRSRSARYSGSERPACRMNHTGVRSTGSRRATRTRSGSVTEPRLAAALGPLVTRWHTFEHGPVQAGALVTAQVEVENIGTAPWRTRGHEDGLFLSYHWLDDRDNPIVWDGRRTALAQVVAPGETLRQELAIRAPIPPGPYRLAVDLVEEHRFWLAELDNAPLVEAVDVQPRDPAGARVYGAEPDDEWLARAAELHREGYSAVGGAIDARGFPDHTAGGGRHPRFPHPLVCPSLLPGLEPNTEANGLPAYRPQEDEPAMFDGRLVLRLRSRSGRRRS